MSTTAPASEPLQDSPFLRAARGEPVAHTPVWFMRQAGRSLPEYLALREGIGMLESCMQPDLVVEITLQPVRASGSIPSISNAASVERRSAVSFDPLAERNTIDCELSSKA